MNYDPNTVRSSDTAHLVKVVLAEWHYRAVYHVAVGGDTAGFGVLQSAVDILESHVPDELHLLDPAGRILVVVGWHDRRVHDMVVSVSVEKVDDEGQWPRCERADGQPE